MPSAKNKVQPQNISHEHELDSKGVYQLANGAWAYRFCKSVNGKNVYKRASTDRKGNPLLTQRDAMLAREEAMLEAQGVYSLHPRSSINSFILAFASIVIHKPTLLFC